MKKDCFGGPGQWYKGNLHSHTTNSDGHLTPAQAVALFRQYGYSFLCLSEHDYYTDLRTELDREDFILLPGVEASSWLVQPPKDPAALQELAAHLSSGCHWGRCGSRWPRGNPPFADRIG